MTSWQWKGFVHILPVYTPINVLLFFYLDSFSMPHTNWEVSMERQFSFWVSNIWAFALVILLTVAVVGVLCNHKWTETQDTCWNELIVACTSLCTLVTVFFLCVCVCVTINGLKLRTHAEMSWLLHAAACAHLLQLQLCFLCVSVTINGLKLRTRAEMSWLMHAAVRARLLQLQ